MINDLKDLKKLFQLCRAQGITAFKMNGVEVTFGDLPIETNGALQPQEIQQDPTNQWANFPDRILTPEELAFYSAGGRPEDVPDNKEAI
jgi:hypothetical protein